MANKTKIPYEGNATAEYPLREAGGIGPRDRLPNNLVELAVLGIEVIQILERRESVRCKQISDSSSGVQYNSTKKKFEYELEHYSENYSFTSKGEIKIIIDRLKIWKLLQTVKNWSDSSRELPAYTHAWDAGRMGSVCTDPLQPVWFANI